ncbi:MAG TPA: DedA family protein [Anaerolineales bacterium]|nr:DedA family protein [Anaerolineales bacterium]
MEILTALLDFFLHLDVHLGELIHTYGGWTYAILFLIIFMETGFVVTPFLPGDSLLFAAGTFAALGSLDPILLFFLLFAAAILGDSVNYWIGSVVGLRAFEKDRRFLNREHLEKTQRFYEKHGGKTIVLARFVPIVRTFAPFVAGVGTMKYRNFVFYNILGAFLWTSLLVFSGYFIGNIPFVKENFEIAIMGIIFLSVLPMIIEYINSRRKKEPVEPLG